MQEGIDFKVYFNAFLSSNHAKDIQYLDSWSQGTTGINAPMTAQINQKLGLVPMPRKGRLCSIRPCSLWGMFKRCQEFQEGQSCPGSASGNIVPLHEE